MKKQPVSKKMSNLDIDGVYANSKLKIEIIKSDPDVWSVKGNITQSSFQILICFIGISRNLYVIVGLYLTN